MAFPNWVRRKRIFFLPVFVQSKVHAEESASTKFLSRSACSAVCKVDIHQTILYTLCQVGMQGGQPGPAESSQPVHNVAKPFLKSYFDFVYIYDFTRYSCSWSNFKSFDNFSSNRRLMKIQIRF